MDIEIITPDENLFKGETDKVIIPAASGLMGILKDHAPLITVLKSGDIVVSSAKGEQTFTVKGGVVEVLNNKIIVLAE